VAAPAPGGGAGGASSGAAMEAHAPSRKFVYACIAAWIANSALCVLTNKHVLYYLKFGFPTTLAVLHMCSAFLSTSALIYLTPDGRRNLPPKGAAPHVFYMQLAGIAALFGLVLVLANSAFMYLSVPSIQMLKVRAGAAWGARRARMGRPHAAACGGGEARGSGRARRRQRPPAAAPALSSSPPRTADRPRAPRRAARRQRSASASRLARSTTPTSRRSRC
jgi:hypothetical protein